MTSWNSYPKIYNLGHAAIEGLLDSPVIVEEKVDGSQFSFGVFDGELRCRSKGAQIDVDAPESMFVKGVAAVKKLAPMLCDGWTYRGEYLRKPKHNSLAYERVPVAHFALFDVNTGDQKYLGRRDKENVALALGLEVTPLVYAGMVEGVEHIKHLMDRESMLGGQKIEGLVFKQYERFGRDGKVLMGKYVSEEFKEVHSKEWKKSNPNGKDIIGALGERYRTDTRWAKAVQRLRDAGQLEGTPKDIGKLVKSVPDDVLTECRGEIEAELMKWAWPKIRRAVVKGLPEYYKEILLKSQFDEGGAA